jgi:hypothetical protein
MTITAVATGSAALIHASTFAASYDHPRVWSGLVEAGKSLASPRTPVPLLLTLTIPFDWPFF